MLPEFLLDMLNQPFLGLVQQRLQTDLLSLSVWVVAVVLLLRSSLSTKSSPVSQVSKYDTWTKTVEFVNNTIADTKTETKGVSMRSLMDTAVECYDHFLFWAIYKKLWPFGSVKHYITMNYSRINKKIRSVVIRLTCLCRFTSPLVEISGT